MATRRVRQELPTPDFINLIALLVEAFPHGVSTKELQEQLRNNTIDFSMGEFTDAINQALADGKIRVRLKMDGQSEILLPYFYTIKK